MRALLESGPRAAARSPLAQRNGFLRLQLRGYRASFLMSTLRNLAHFLEDDTAPQVLPMEISVRDTHVTLKVRMAAVTFHDGCYFYSAIQSFGVALRRQQLQSVYSPCFRKTLVLVSPRPVAVMGLVSHCRTAEQVSITPLESLSPGAIGLCLWTEYFMAQMREKKKKKKKLSVLCSRTPVLGTVPPALSPRPSACAWTASSSTDETTARSPLEVRQS